MPYCPNMEREIARAIQWHSLKARVSMVRALQSKRQSEDKLAAKPLCSRTDKKQEQAWIAQNWFTAGCRSTKGMRWHGMRARATAVELLQEHYRN